MKQFLYLLNMKFDYIDEPNRFFTFLALGMPGIIATAVVERFPLIGIVGLIYLMVLLAVRFVYIQGWLKP